MKLVVGSLLLVGVACASVPQVALASETITYSYDALGRLIKVVSSGSVNNGQAHTICYDEAGNRVTYKSDATGALAACVDEG